MRKILFRGGSVLLLIIIAGVMLFVGRGHTIYFDNKNLEYEGTKYEAIRRITSGVGPIKEMPCEMHFSANSAFSERKP